MALWKIPYTGATYVYADTPEEAAEMINNDDFLCDTKVYGDPVETTEEDMCFGLVGEE